MLAPPLGQAKHQAPRQCTFYVWGRKEEESGPDPCRDTPRASPGSAPSRSPKAWLTLGRLPGRPVGTPRSVCGADRRFQFLSLIKPKKNCCRQAPQCWLGRARSWTHFRFAVCDWGGRFILFAGALGQVKIRSSGISGLKVNTRSNRTDARFPAALSMVLTARPPHRASARLGVALVATVIWERSNRPS